MLIAGKRLVIFIQMQQLTAGQGARLCLELLSQLFHQRVMLRLCLLIFLVPRTMQVAVLYARTIAMPDTAPHTSRKQPRPPPKDDAAFIS